MAAYDKEPQPETEGDDSEREGVQDALELMVISPPDLETFGVKAPDWTDERQRIAAYALSIGASQEEAAGVAGVHRSTLSRWLRHPGRGIEFRRYISQLALLTGMAQRGERVRQAKELARRRFAKELQEPSKRHTWLDYARFVADETASMAPVELPPRVRVAQAVIIGTQINVAGLEKLADDVGDG
jgi:transposase-like protein